MALTIPILTRIREAMRRATIPLPAREAAPVFDFPSTLIRKADVINPYRMAVRDHDFPDVPIGMHVGTPPSLKQGMERVTHLPFRPSIKPNPTNRQLPRAYGREGR